MEPNSDPQSPAPESMLGTLKSQLSQSATGGSWAHWSDSWSLSFLYHELEGKDRGLVGLN